jgi:hypothetical protein
MWEPPTVQNRHLKGLAPDVPEDFPYTTLRTELPSGERPIRQLLTLEEMGDRKPSQFLRHLRGLAPDVPEDFLYTIPQVFHRLRFSSYFRTDTSESPSVM